jgi:lipid-binding SYLF domain-containing protein
MRFETSELIIDLVRYLGAAFAIGGAIGTVIAWVSLDRHETFAGYPFIAMAIAGIGIFVGCTSAMAQIVTARASVEALRKLDQIKAATESRQ